jgi:hypothetical protein
VRANKEQEVLKIRQAIFSFSPQQTSEKTSSFRGEKVGTGGRESEREQRENENKMWKKKIFN